MEETTDQKQGGELEGKHMGSNSQVEVGEQVEDCDGGEIEHCIKSEMAVNVNKGGDMDVVQ